MDEILVADIHVLAELEQLDLWIGDGVWERKGTLYAWPADFVGFLPIPSAGSVGRSCAPATTRRCVVAPLRS